jgi:hypothetical protein
MAQPNIRSPFMAPPSTRAIGVRRPNMMIVTIRISTAEIAAVTASPL